MLYIQWQLGIVKGYLYTYITYNAESELVGLSDLTS